MFNLWIYNRRPACSARMQHGGSASVQPTVEIDADHVERAEARAVVNASQSGVVENKVLPFRTPGDTVPRDRKPRGRSKGRSKG